MGNYLYVVRMDVAHDKDAIFNEIYDKEHIPEILKVPGVRRVSRFWTSSRTDPKYMALYEFDNPNVRETAEWKRAAEAGRWANEVRPYTMNRHTQAIFSWVGGHPELTQRTKYLFFVMMDVEPHKEALFNELYNNEHVPVLSSLAGIVSCVRYKAIPDIHPRYLAVYEIERPDVPTSPAFLKARDIGRWDKEVRPYTYNKRLPVYERIEPKK